MSNETKTLTVTLEQILGPSPDTTVRGQLISSGYMSDEPGQSIIRGLMATIDRLRSELASCGPKATP